MSFTRLDYDGCAYAKDFQESTSPLEYLMYKGKYENCKNCPDHTNNLEFGTKVEVESELRNITRQTSKCPSKKYDPKKNYKGADFTPARVCENIHYLTPSGLKKPETDGFKGPRDTVAL